MERISWFPQEMLGTRAGKKTFTDTTLQVKILNVQLDTALY